jgi:PTS system mannose-specific IIA component
MSLILVMAHAPLASALKQCVQHVFPDDAHAVLALDVPADEHPLQTLDAARALLRQRKHEPVLVLCDVLGATPCNVATQLAKDKPIRVVAGVNLPMLLRTVCYREQDPDALAVLAQEGASQGVMQVDTAAAKP